MHGLQWRYAKSFLISKKETLEEMDIRTGGVTQDLVLIVTVTGTQMVLASTGAARMAPDTTTEMDMAALKTEEDLAVEVVEERVLTSIAYLSEDLILAPMTIT